MATANATARAEVVRRKVHDGVLPPERCLKLWAGVGTGRRCEACEQPTLPPDIEYECQVQEARTIHLCRPCFAAWEIEIAQPRA
jgi:hypothetical protein